MSQFTECAEWKEWRNWVVEMAHHSVRQFRHLTHIEPFEQMPDESAQPYLDTTPPHWVARGLAHVIIAAFALTLVAAILVKVPETVSGPLPWCRSRNRSGTGGEERVLVEVRVAEGDNVTRGSTSSSSALPA